MGFGTIDPRHTGSGRKHREARKARRLAVGAAGWIRPDGGFARRPCTVLDISDTGVRISVADGQTVPSVFNFVSAKTGGLGRRARVKWKRGNEIGGEFI
jgi:hypothetical protein